MVTVQTLLRRCGIVLGKTSLCLYNLAAVDIANTQLNMASLVLYCPGV